MAVSYEDVSATVASEDVFNLYISSALDVVERYMCYAPTETASQVDGIVSANGLTVDLPLWASSVTSVEYDGASCDYTFVPSIGDYQPNTVPISYAYTLTLAEGLMPGSIVTVYGTFGFESLPSSFMPLIGYIINALADQSSQTDNVTSKSIEDVSVSLDKDYDPLSKITTLFGGTIAKWSLCGAYRNPLGSIGTDQRLPDKPWWVTDDDLNIIGG